DLRAFDSEFLPHLRRGGVAELVGMPAGHEPLIVADHQPGLVPLVGGIARPLDRPSVTVHGVLIAGLTTGFRDTIATRNVALRRWGLTPITTQIAALGLGLGCGE